MFDNIGSKIKSLAMVLFILGVIASIVSAIYLFLIDEDLLGVRNLFLGPIFSYLSVLVLYGFGEIITKLTEIEKNTRSTPQPEKYSPENWSNAEPKRTSDYVNTEK